REVLVPEPAPPRGPCTGDRGSGPPQRRVHRGRSAPGPVTGDRGDPAGNGCGTAGPWHTASRHGRTHTIRDRPGRGPLPGCAHRLGTGPCRPWRRPQTRGAAHVPVPRTPVLVAHTTGTDRPHRPRNTGC